jgi:hypothetical protein
MKRLLAAGALALAFVLCAGAAQATGTLKVYHFYGGEDTYDNVSIKVIHMVLYVTSRDGKGTLVINRAACYQQQVLTCLPNGMTIVQAGSVKPIHLKTGTIYYNNQTDPQTLPLSSTSLPPMGILFSLKTDYGTYISLDGVVDKVVK